MTCRSIGASFTPDAGGVLTLGGGRGLAGLSGFGFLPDGLKHVPDPGAGALGRARLQRMLSQTIPRAGFRAGVAFAEERAVVKVLETCGRNCQGGLAVVVVKEKQAALDRLEIDLVADDLQAGVFEEHIPVRPCLAAVRTYFESLHHRPVPYLVRGACIRRSRDPTALPLAGSASHTI
jgi:hypothetical protein